MPKRSRLEIYIDVLQIIAEGTGRPTNVMYKANLSWRPLQECLSSLLDQNLIRRTSRGKRSEYTITESGLQVLRYFDRVKKAITLQL